MSVAAVSQVWKYSRAKGGPLLVLLAIADYAHDDGRDAWPSLETLAKKSRMTDRAVRFILKQLETQGEITVEANREGREVYDGHVPKWFIHVLCVEGKDFTIREKFSQHPSEKISQKVKNHVRIPPPQSEKSRTDRSSYLFSDPSGSVKNKNTGASAPEFPQPPKKADTKYPAAEPQTPTHAQLCLLVREVLEADPDGTYPDQIEDLKQRAARRRWTYTGEALKKAFDAVEHAERKRRRA